jgi:hypothetical protein
MAGETCNARRGVVRIFPNLSVEGPFSRQIMQEGLWEVKG